jgi:hypothetical protein
MALKEYLIGTWYHDIQCHLARYTRTWYSYQTALVVSTIYYTL